MGVPLLTVVPADLFGLKSLGAVFGVLFFMGNVGAAIGPPLSGWIYDVSGSYVTAFVVATVVGASSFCFSAILMRSKESAAGPLFAVPEASAAKRA
jgi:MFS family permease